MQEAGRPWLLGGDFSVPSGVVANWLTETRVPAIVLAPSSGGYEEEACFGASPRRQIDFFVAHPSLGFLCSEPFVTPDVKMTPREPVGVRILGEACSARVWAFQAPRQQPTARMIGPFLPVVDHAEYIECAFAKCHAIVGLGVGGFLF